MTNKKLDAPVVSSGSSEISPETPPSMPVIPKQETKKKRTKKNVEEDIILRLPISLRDLGFISTKPEAQESKPDSSPNPNIFTITDLTYDSSASSEDMPELNKDSRKLMTRIQELER